MAYYTKGNKKHGEIIKAEFDIFALENTGQRVDYKGTTNANPVNDIQNKNYQA